MTRKVLHGVAVSAGIAIGRAFYLHRGMHADPVDGFVPFYRIDAEITRLDAAFEATHTEIEEARKRLDPKQKEQLGILAAHSMICKDPKFVDAARTNIRDKNLPA
ncbi:MAG: phosphoenolpyruvate--protein phosphotransferase, partial [Deltaproteobacteria bacterium]|nr:phosphoenolpyruvate--protein phosphotransferase [Deltaproteobacteria bacterium]